MVVLNLKSLSIGPGILVIIFGLVGCQPGDAPNTQREERQTPTSNPTAAPSVVVGNLGVTRSEMRRAFDEFTFEPVETLDDGKESVTGWSRDGLEAVTFIGPSEDLSRVFIMGVIHPTDRNVNGMQAVRRWTLLSVVLAEWEEGSDWLTDRTREVTENKPASIVVDSAEVTLRRAVRAGSDMIMLDIERIR